VALFVYVLALAAGQERFQPLLLGGVLVGLAGVLCVLLPRSKLPTQDMALWVAIGLLTPFL